MKMSLIDYLLILLILLQIYKDIYYYDQPITNH
jgi:hypothetical protein